MSMDSCRSTELWHLQKVHINLNIPLNVQGRLMHKKNLSLAENLYRSIRHVHHSPDILPFSTYKLFMSYKTNSKAYKTDV